MTKSIIRNVVLLSILVSMLFPPGLLPVRGDDADSTIDNVIETSVISYCHPLAAS